MTRLPEHAVVIGAGPAGLCLGWNLAKDDREVTILEKTAVIGGLAQTFEEDGYLLDLGPHNIHTVHPEIQAFLERILGADLVPYDPRTDVLFGDRRIEYPIRGIRVFTTLPLWLMLPAGVSFLWARIKMLLRNPSCDDSFESWIRNRFGGVLYSVYFGPYAEKTWKIAPSEISSYVAEKRVPVLSIPDVLRGLLGSGPKNSHAEWSPGNYYPRKGVGQICSILGSGLVERGGKIEHDVEILGIELAGRRVEKIRYRQGGQTRQLETEFLFSTMPIDQLISLLGSDVPQEVRQAAAQLDFCSETLLYIKLNRTQVFDPALIYFSMPKIRFTRVSRVDAFSRDCVPDGKTALCVEFTCNQGDQTWESSAAELYRYTLGVCEEYGLLSEDAVDGYFIRRITHAYPLFRVGFEQRLRCIIEYLSSLENVVTLGRQGLFCYANVDDVLQMAFQASEMLDRPGLGAVGYHTLFPNWCSYATPD